MGECGLVPCDWQRSVITEWGSTPFNDDPGALCEFNQVGNVQHLTGAPANLNVVHFQSALELPPGGTVEFVSRGPITRRVMGG